MNTNDYVRDRLVDILSQLCAKENHCEDCLFWNEEEGKKECDDDVLDELSLEQLADKVCAMAFYEL